MNKNQFFFCPDCKQLSLIRWDENQKNTFCPKCDKILTSLNIHFIGAENSIKNKAKNLAKDILVKVLKYLNKPEKEQ